MRTAHLLLAYSLAIFAFEADAQGPPGQFAANQTLRHDPPGLSFERPAVRYRSKHQVLDLSTVPVIIDVPGTYALDRDWDDLPALASPGVAAVQIAADDVVLDLRGFTIINEGPAIEILGARVLVRDGELVSEAVQALRSSGSRTIIEKVVARGFAGVLLVGESGAVSLSGSGSVVRDSNMSSRSSALRVGSDTLVERNVITCFFGCIVLGSNNQLTNNTLSGQAGNLIAIDGDDNLIDRNTIDQFAGAVDHLMIVSGNRNVIRDNTLWASENQVVFTVDGTQNIIDGNIASPNVQTGARATIGIKFTRDGNFYGDNRLAALVFSDNGGTVQTDWGGNVTF